MQQPVRLWDASGGAEQSSLQGSAVGPQGIAFASDSRRLVTLTDDGLAALWDVTNPRSPVRGASIGDQGDRVTSVAYASDGAVIVTGTVGGTVSVWDVSDPAAPQRASTMRRHAGAVGGLAADSGGDLFATAGEDGVVVIWSLGDAARPLELTTLRTGSIYDAALLAFSRKGALAASSEREFVLFDTDVSGILSRLCAESTPIDQTEWLRYLPAFDYDPPCA